MYVIIGANGFIGSYVIKNILEKTDETVLALGRSLENSDDCGVRFRKCDITNLTDVKRIGDMLKNEGEIKAVYLAAYHHPDAVKLNPEFAWNVNVTSLSYCLNAWPRFQCLFYASSEMVYGSCDLKDRFSEEDRLNPVNLYGRHKMVAESIVLGYGYNVVRFPFIIGPSLLKNKRHFYDEIVDTIKMGNVIEMFADAYKMALDFNTAASLLIDLMESYDENIPSVLNISSDTVMSKFEIGIKIAQKNKLDVNKVVPIFMENNSSIYTEKRAICTLMNNNLLKKTLKISSIEMTF